MKKIILTILMLTSLNLYASDKAECEKLFKNAIYNFYLENSCKFDKHLSSLIRKDFGNKECTKFFSDADMKKLNSEVLGQSYQQMKKIGKDNFCTENRANYNKLASSYASE